MLLPMLLGRLRLMKLRGEFLADPLAEGLLQQPAGIPAKRTILGSRELGSTGRNRIGEIPQNAGLGEGAPV